jgi:hypothetical protein
LFSFDIFIVVVSFSNINNNRQKLCQIIDWAI